MAEARFEESDQHYDSGLTDLVVCNYDVHLCSQTYPFFQISDNSYTTEEWLVNELSVRVTATGLKLMLQ